MQRIWQHKNDFVEGFTKRYGVHTLVWFEAHESMESAIAREKAIKEWSPDVPIPMRDQIGESGWKVELIEQGNPTWSRRVGILRDCLTGFRFSPE